MEKLQNLENLPTPVRVIFENRANLAAMYGEHRAQYTPPAAEHYMHLYPWDAATAAEILAHFGYTRQAETELFSIFNRQRANGMVPNMQRVEEHRRDDPELATFSEPHISADYSQPPIWPMAISSLYELTKKEDPVKAKYLLQALLSKAKPSLRYFADNRQLSSTNPLIYNITPEETGRDCDKSLNGHTRFQLPRKGAETNPYVDLYNAGIWYLGKIALGRRNLKNNWDPQEIRKYYAAVDPMFNSIYAYNLRVIGDLAQELEEYHEAESFYDKADAVEERVISDLWEPDAAKGTGAFLVDNVYGRSDVISITALGPLLLKGLPEDRLESILKLMKSSFNTPLPLPTVATDSWAYDPNGQQPHNVWTGEVMMIANWLTVKALRQQASRQDLTHRPDLTNLCLHWSENKILPASKRAISQGYYEGYHPVTFAPRRAETVWNFIWNGSIETL